MPVRDVPKRGTVLVREWQGRMEHVMVLADGFGWNGSSYPSLSAVALAITGTKWNGRRFFSLDRPEGGQRSTGAGHKRTSGRERDALHVSGTTRQPPGPRCADGDARRLGSIEATCFGENPAMKPVAPKLLRCAIYTRVSTEHGLDQEFNSLDNQREAAQAYIKSQAHEGWRPIRERYDDGGFSGGSLDRPALQRLLADIRARRIDVVVVYKVDRLTRSLADFAKLVELFDAHDVSFVSVTQSFNTTTSMGRLTLNVLLSFAQFEREVTGERIRDKIAASKRKGIWVGGCAPGSQARHRRGRSQDRPAHLRAPGR